MQRRRDVSRSQNARLKEMEDVVNDSRLLLSSQDWTLSDFGGDTSMDCSCTATDRGDWDIDHETSSDWYHYGHGDGRLSFNCSVSVSVERLRS